MTRRKQRDHKHPKPAIAPANPPAVSKEEVGRWESEGGAPSGGRNPAAINNGQSAPTSRPGKSDRQ